MRDKKSSVKEYRAVKILSKAYMEEKDLVSFKNEVVCMSRCQHPNIMNIYGFYEDAKRYLLITELCRGGDLFETVAKKRMSQGEAATILKQILSAVSHMHEK